jgi:hypothetical protein
MPISTTSNNPNPVMTTEERKLRIADLREHHQPVFDALELTNALFFPKMAYRPKDKNELHLSFFPSELKRGFDIYTEFVSREYEPEDQERTLWKWRFNPHWEEEYECTKDLQPRYLIPVSELIKVNAPKKATPAQGDFFDGSFNLTDDDAPLSELTIRDLAAILLREPVSKKEWLNNLIK